LSSNIEAKKAIVMEAMAEVAKAKTIVIAEYRGVSVASLTKLRLQARERGIFLRVLKNTLARRSVKGTPFANLSEKMVGPLLYSMSADPIAAAKVLCRFGATEEALVVKGGNYNGQLLTDKEVVNLSLIPDYKELVAKLLGIMQSPIASLARVLAAISAKKEAEEA
jgi:large subunit ribosomal protein L10